MKYRKYKREFSFRIRQLRGNQTQGEVALRCGVERTSWTYYESGKQIPGLISLALITHGLELSKDDLYWLIMGGERTPNESESENGS